ncbi:MAG: bifunctional phosphoserine phosphatase/homoserine phosphotransferase ThrH [Candidatus Lokiarchaeota archaeon]|nr:bifunctional phosphoserine phosphatase/homoserine phosphotransferase ThrH [Candidatus Lokiarchaeota archaeon]
MFVVFLDLEGVFTPEIWEFVAADTNIEKLSLTTRDIPDYDVLMKQRLEILRENNISLYDIQKTIGTMNLLPGAVEFLQWLRSNTQVIFVTDSFVEFIKPFAQKLNFPMIFCHDLEIDKDGFIINYNLRLRDMKKNTVKVFKNLNYNIIAIGDSYNDIGMLTEADYGILFRPPDNVREEFPQFLVTTKYTELKKFISNHLGIE